MNCDEAKITLLRYRPWETETEDAALQEALAAARSDPGLSEWFEAHCRFQQAMRTTLRTTPLTQTLIRRPEPAARWVFFPGVAARVWKMAAVLLVLLTLGLLFWREPADGSSFAVLRARLVQSVLRGYPMDVVSTSDAVLRSFLRERGAPADYELRPPLAELPILGGGIRSWRDTKVAMVCLQARDQGTLFVFVTARSVVSDAPDEVPSWANVKTCATASWSEGGRTYLIALEAPPAELRQYVPAPRP